MAVAFSSDGSAVINKLLQTASNKFVEVADLKSYFCLQRCLLWIKHYDFGKVQAILKLYIYLKEPQEMKLINY